LLRRFALHTLTVSTVAVIIGLGSTPLTSSGNQGTPAATDAAISAGTTRTDSKGIEQVWVPAGCFQMGTDPATLADPAPYTRETPQHEVCLTKGYWIDKYEVTVEAYQKFVEDGGYTTQANWSENGWYWLSRRDLKTLPIKCEGEQPTHPRVCITWHEADAYSRWRGGRLPTEAEWEFAARGPESRIYPWGNDWDEKKANVVGSKGLVPVGSYPDGVSWVGAHDMSGNAMEWVNDWLDDKYYEQKVKDDPQGPPPGTRKVEKGGWWGAKAEWARSAYRHYEDPPTYQDHHIGLRVMTPADGGSAATPPATAAK
jgi:formylglycine-generating enzyme required for sulfatase activity